MGDMITYHSADGTSLSAYQALPDRPARGGLIICQEIFGVNPHIKEVCDSYAADGWHVIAPCLFDPAAPDISLPYDSDGKQTGLGYKDQVDGRAEGDIAAAAALFPLSYKRAIIGFCWGGSLAWRMACYHTLFDAAVSYYGGQLPALSRLSAHCPVLAHFGTLDVTIPIEGVTDFRQSQPDVTCHLYEADHGFNCDHRPQYHADSAHLARQRTDAFLAQYCEV